MKKDAINRGRQKYMMLQSMDEWHGRLALFMQKIDKLYSSLAFVCTTKVLVLKLYVLVGV